MVVVSASEISKSYGADIIFKDASFHVNEGDRIGIVGDNGTGKSTLLSILAGDLAYDSGNLYISSKIDLGYLRQNYNFTSDKTVFDEMLSIFSKTIAMERKMNQLAQKITADSEMGKDVDSLLAEYDSLHNDFEESRGFSYLSEIRGILSSMAFPEDYYNKKISTLSGGERTRLALAALLLQKPQLLLLDEPTNHLDIGTLKWLEQFLENYSGTLIIISHDRYFLDKIVTHTFQLENSSLNVFDGNYSSFLEKKKNRDQELLRKYEKQKREISRQEEMIRRFKQRGTEKLAKRAKSREKRLNHVERLDRPSHESKSMGLAFKENFQSGNDVLSVRGLSMSFSEGREKRVLFENLDMDIKRGERVCILGANGVGKTTLLNIITGKVSPDTGLVKAGQNVVMAYYDQQQAMLHKELTVLDEIHESYRLYTESELRNFLGRFSFQADDVFKKVQDLSGGERAKLSLLKLMLSGSNFLIMDEPTNHLDITAKEAFEDAVLDFPGTVLIVSHDRYLLNKIPSRIMDLSSQGLTSYLGGYDYYFEKKQSQMSTKDYLNDLGKAVSLQTDENEEGQRDEISLKEARALERSRAKKEERERRRLERQLSEAETRIEELEKEIRQIEEDLCLEEVFTDHLLSASYSQKLTEAKESLGLAYDDWVRFHEEI